MADQTIRTVRTDETPSRGDLAAARAVARRTGTRNPWGPLGVTTASYDSGNRKTGPCMATYAVQISCPNGVNNPYRCPLLGVACYGEEGDIGRGVMPPLNRNAGFDHKGDVTKANVTPEQVAMDEAAALDTLKKEFNKNPKPLRLHVVGDCVTPETARIVGKAAAQYAFRYQGDMSKGIQKAPPQAKSVWNYTHAWREVSRSDWPSSISVLASCDNPADLPKAHARGYGGAIVIDTYQQTELGNYGAAYKLPNGFKIIPCPHEVQRLVDEGEAALIAAALQQKGVKGEKVSSNMKVERARELAEKYLSEAERGEIDQKQAETFRGKGGTRKDVQCLHCKLCWMDDFLRDNKAAVAFALHGPRAKKNYGADVKDLLQIEGAK